MIHSNLFETQAALSASLSRALSEQLSLALEQHETITFYVSGGSTPRPIYENLSEHPIDWSRIQVALVDERWVPETDPESNAGMIRRSLLRNRAAMATFQGMYLPGQAVQDGLEDCQQAYRRLPRSFSLCLLGMGADGHFASLFPEATGLQAALSGQQPCAAIEAKPSAVTGRHTSRMTLTLLAILRCDKIFLLFTGAEKWRIYEEALRSENPCRYPVSAILQQTEKDIELYWSP